MSRINVNTISGIGGTFVTLLHGATGDASRLTFPPTTIAFSPDILSTGAEIDTNIIFTFNQNIEFFGTPGNIEIRQGSASGSLIESFETGTSSRLSISANTLTIDPTSNLTHETTYYVILPPVGIANTLNALYSGSESYNFTTKVNEYTVTGAQYSFSRLDPGSPTGYYKYHIFTGTTPFSVNKPAAEAVDLDWVLIGGGASGGTGYSPGNAGGGGGGAGGVKSGTGPTLNLPGPATYIFTQGAGGSMTSNSPGPSTDGTGSTIATPGGSVKESVLGGGGGGGYPFPSPTYHNGRPGASGGGSGGGPHPQDGPQIHPQWPTRGYQAPPSVAGGAGTSGQGSNGGRSANGYCPNHGSPRWFSGGGGGGAGGTGGSANYPSWDQPTYWPNYHQPQYWPNWKCTGGTGGPGKPVPAFSGPNLLGMMPIPAFPLDFLLNTHGSGAGPTGHYGGGGGGGSTSSTNLSSAGNGGSGGGGHGSYVRTPGSYIPTPFLPSWPVQSPSSTQSRPGYQYSGGGGGGGPAPGSYPQVGNGGSGCFMIRHATPEALS